MTTSNEGLWSHRRLALLIGNDSYQAKNKLSYSNNNASDLKTILKQIQFNVTLLLDVKEDLMNNIANFAKQINDGDLVFFYFSGHSYQIDGENYLIPTHDSKIQTETDIIDFGCRAHSALQRLKRKNPSYVTIFILDCSSPYVLENGSIGTARIESRRLAPMQPLSETFIQFACGANQISIDMPRVDRNSLFTKYLLQSIAEPNIPIMSTFKCIEDAVYKHSNQRQRPLSMNGLKQYTQLCLNNTIIDQAMKMVFESVLDNCVEILTQVAVTQVMEELVEKVTRKVINQELIQFMEEISEEVIVELLVEEAVENVMEHITEEIAQQVVENILEEFAEQCVTELMELVVIEFMNKLLPPPYTVEECNRLLAELTAELETLTLKNTYKGAQKSVALIAELRALIRTLTTYRNQVNRANFSISVRKQQTRPS